MSRHLIARIAAIAGLVALGVCLYSYLRPSPLTGSESETLEPHRSPISIALSNDGSLILTANQTSNSVSMVDPESGKILDEIETGERPAGVALSPDGTRGVVTHWYGYDVAVLAIEETTIQLTDRIVVGPEPRGVVISNDGALAFVTVGVSNEVVRIDLDAGEVTGRVTVGREPRGIAITPDGSHLLVGNARSTNMSVIGVDNFEVVRTLPIQGENLRQVAIASDGVTGYVVNMYSKGFATTDRNIDLGWVLGQRLSRVALDGTREFSTLTLDPQGDAVGDVHGVAISGDERYIAIGAGGTHEVLLFRTDLNRLPWRTGGSRDLISPRLLRKDGTLRRIEVGGRPTELVFAPDNRTLYVANYLDDSIQVIDAETGSLINRIGLGAPEKLSLVREGEILFHDARRSHNQWYSCNTCHSDGHTNGGKFDTKNDGWHDYSNLPKFSKKMVPSLRGVTETGPWTWHGWQKSLDEAMIESFITSMQGKHPSDHDVEAIVAYLGTLDFPPNPYRLDNGELTESAKRGELVFRSPEAACNTCHGGPHFTDGKIHNVGLETRRDVYEGYNPPSLLGVYDRDPYLHDGRAATLREVLEKDHAPDFVTGLGDLTDQELDDLIAYLKSL